MHSVTNTSVPDSESEASNEETETEEAVVEGNEDDDDDEGKATFLPQLIKGYYDKSTGNSYKAGVKTLGLPNAIHRVWEKQSYEYDPKWMEQHGVPEEVLKDFVSRIRFDELIPKGALKLNDELYIEGKTAQGVKVEKSATVSPPSSSTLLWRPI